MLKVDIYIREGVYPTPNFPRTMGQEAAGVVVALPTSEEVLNDETYKKRGLKVGDRVVAVRVPLTSAPSRPQLI